MLIEPRGKYGTRTGHVPKRFPGIGVPRRSTDCRYVPVPRRSAEHRYAPPGWHPGHGPGWRAISVRDAGPGGAADAGCGAMPGGVAQGGAAEGGRDAGRARSAGVAPCRVAWLRAGVMPAAPGLRVWRHAGWRGRGRALVPSVRRSYGGRRRRGWRSRGRAWCRGRPVCAPGTMPGGAAACAEPRVRRRRGWRTFSERCFVTGGVPCGGRGAVRAVHRSVRRCREGGGVAP